MATPDDILKELDPEQKEAVTHEKGPLLIIAGAGTGKTAVITRRVAWLIATKTAKPEEILALTFTDKAATEMEERVDILVPYGYTQTWVSTFHAFGDRLLRENALELGLPSDIEVLSRPQQIVFFQDHLFEFPLDYYCPLSKPTSYIEAILTLFSRAKDEDIDPAEYLAYVQQLEAKSKNNPDDEALQEEVFRQSEIAQTYKKYQELLTREGKMDFGDQITLTLKLFREHPAILKKYQQRFQYILVDEFQDTNYAQFQLVKLLAERHQNITVVGDDDQSIYKFRGAAISNILGFMDAYPSARQIVLTKNYRSPQTILNTAYHLIVNNNPDRLEIRNKIDKHLISQVDYEKKEVEHLHYDTLSSEADGVAQLIKEKVKGEKYSYRDFAILVRANDQADPFLRSLNMLDIPWRFTGTRGLYAREEVKLMLAFLRVVSNPDDSENLYSLVSSEIYQFSPEDLNKLSNFAQRRNRSLSWTFKHFEEIPELTEEVTSFSRKLIEKILKDIEKYQKLAVGRPTGEILYRFITETGWLKNLTSSNNEEAIKNMAKFFDIVRNTSGLLTADRVNQFIPYLTTLIQAGEDPAVAEEADIDVDAVNVLTVHKAKGLEFPVVFMVGLIDRKFPTDYRKEPIPLPDDLVKDILPTQKDFHLQEERRLFYVGMTRAKKELYLTSGRDYGGKRPRKLSRFVCEALDLPKQVSPRQTSALETIARYAPEPEKKTKLLKLIPPSERLTLSYYKIDDYLACPLKYKYVHIIRLPVMRHHTVIYGTAIHKAIQEYYQRRLAGKEITEQDLERVFRNAWSSEGFLSREHEERRFAEGLQTLNRFYQTQQASDWLPTYIEKDFSFNLGTNRIIGRWDRIDESPEEVSIIDFKSSQIHTQEDADKRARESLQLEIYALAYEKQSNRIPDWVGLYFVESQILGKAVKTEKQLQKTIEKIEQASAGIRVQKFPPAPTHNACRWCAYQQICPSAKFS